MDLAISVLQPFAQAIMDGTKRYEDRSYRPARRLLAGEPLIIHAARAAWHDVFESAIPLGQWTDPQILAFGAILGIVRITSVEDHEFGFRWHLADPRSCRPIAASGAQRFWRPTPTALYALDAHLAA